MAFKYKIMSFNKKIGTMEVWFDGITPLNYTAPRTNGVYLSGIQLENYIQNLHPSIEVTNEILESQIFEDDPATITGGEDIQVKYDAYRKSIS